MQLVIIFLIILDLDNGYTPHEIFEKFEKPHLRPLPDKPFDFNANNVIDMNTRRKSKKRSCLAAAVKNIRSVAWGKSHYNWW